MAALQKRPQFEKLATRLATFPEEQQANAIYETASRAAVAGQLTALKRP
jgi:hypothetical protein